MLTIEIPIDVDPNIIADFVVEHTFDDDGNEQTSWAFFLFSIAELEIPQCCHECKKFHYLGGFILDGKCKYDLHPISNASIIDERCQIYN